jgi:peptidyl-tRNA hydrolase
MVGHVLSPFTAEEEAVIGPAVGRAADAVQCWLTSGIAAAMNRFNKGEDPADG